MQKGAHGAGLSSDFEIGVLADNSRGFTSQLEQAGLEVSASELTDDFSYAGAARKVDFLDGWIFDEGFGNGRGIVARVDDDVEHTVREPSFFENGANGPCRTGSKLGPFENRRVACGDCIGYGAEPKDVWCIPILPELTSSIFRDGTKDTYQGAIPRITPYGSLNTSADLLGSFVTGTLP